MERIMENKYIFIIKNIMAQKETRRPIALMGMDPPCPAWLVVL